MFVIGTGVCVKCPHDRTLVAKASFGRVVLQKPGLLACSGRRAPRSTKFVQMYGPKFGTLLEQGSHMVIGQIMDRNKVSITKYTYELLKLFTPASSNYLCFLHMCYV